MASKIRDYIKLLMVTLFLTLPRASRGNCSQGYIQAGNTCVVQDPRCPQSHVYFNGVCNAITQNVCTASEISINNGCCPIACVTNCVQQQTCYCCGISNYISPCVQQSTCCTSTICANPTSCPPTCHPSGTSTVSPVTPLPPNGSSTPVSPTLPPVNPDDCPSGTVKIGGKCHTFYCPKGTVLKNGRCLVIECPDGTVWTGFSCSPVKPIEHNIVFNHTVTSHFNGTKTDIAIHRVNNLAVDASVTLQLPSKHGHSGDDYHYDDDRSDCDDSKSDEVDGSGDKCGTDDSHERGTNTTNTATNTTQKCCIVRSPRVCEKKDGRWSCHNRRKYLCGKICVAPMVYLRPPRMHYQHPWMVMPPMSANCQTAGMCPPVRDYHDCSGCSGGHMEFCSTYCYRYNCPSHRCRFYDQRQYCFYYPGSFGCQEADGCYETWCSNAM
uniref:Sushi domain-containing protein n=1 Tax=Glossina pallidipes TaxID=7398 RepID=A0A1B0A2N0_GLOPL